MHKIRGKFSFTPLNKNGWHRPNFREKAQFISGGLLYRISPKPVNKCRQSVAQAPTARLTYRQLAQTPVCTALLYRKSRHSDKQLNG
jgi:hypothetical protein